MPKPYNFLKTCRKRAGLSQAEAAKLIGSRGRLQFARYERHQVDPPLRIAVACEQVFGVPVAELFAGLNDEVNATTLRRCRTLKEQLSRAILLQPNSRQLLEVGVDRGAARFVADTQAARSAMKTYQTIVAFDIHPTRIGYAALFRGRVVDCGVTRLRRDHLQTSKHLRHLVEELCRLWQPAVAIVQTSRRNRGRHTGVIRRALAGEGIPTRRVPARARQGGSPTKYEMASDLARRFPELNRLLPRKRRLWDPEDDRLHIFTAVGLAILFSPRTGKKEIQKIGQVAE